jgi:hypothetical protein
LWQRQAWRPELLITTISPKKAIVLDLYHRESEEMQPKIRDALSGRSRLDARLRALINVKLMQFAKNGAVLRGLLRSDAGPGAVRYCEFSTGAFVEPIEEWDEARLLSRDEESGAHEGVVALSRRRPGAPERLHNFRARLVQAEGATLGPDVAQRNHLRVLRHIAQLSERRTLEITTARSPCVALGLPPLQVL